MTALDTVDDLDDPFDPRPAVDVVAATVAARDLLLALGADLERPGLQERLTAQIADWLQDQLEPRGVGVVLEAEHLCMSLRGVRAPGSRTTTSAVHGLVRDDSRSRQEFFALTGGHC